MGFSVDWNEHTSYTSSLYELPQHKTHFMSMCASDSTEGASLTKSDVAGGTREFGQSGSNGEAGRWCLFAIHCNPRQTELQHLNAPVGILTLKIHDDEKNKKQNNALGVRRRNCSSRRKQNCD